MRGFILASAGRGEGSEHPNGADVCLPRFAPFLTAVSAVQLDLIPPPSISLEDLFAAYLSCRRNKRRTANAAAFEVNYEENLVSLCHEINSGTYQPGPSLAFIVDKPVKREIFAADFRDRVVHHLIINKINHILEREFIHDSYSCRVGKGTHFGIRRVDRFIRRCSRNYTRDAYVLKLDIRGFFMSINRERLYRQLAILLRAHYTAPDRELLIRLCRTVINNDPARNCRIRGHRSNWDGLPRDKSLFHARPGCGLPIGNFTSQVLANLYLNPLDHYIKHTVGVRYYGRYVDDFVIVHEDRRFLSALVPRIASFLSTELDLTLHPRKIYLQHYRHGVPFLGAVIKPGYILMGDRTCRNAFAAVERHNRIVEDHRPARIEREHFLSSMNSYLGIMHHYATANLQTHLLEQVSPWWWRWFTLGPTRYCVPLGPAHRRYYTDRHGTLL